MGMISRLARRTPRRGLIASTPNGFDRVGKPLSSNVPGASSRTNPTRVIPTAIVQANHRHLGEGR
jgi:hypothetical protein